LALRVGLGIGSLPRACCRGFDLGGSFGAAGRPCHYCFLSFAEGADCSAGRHWVCGKNFWSVHSSARSDRGLPGKCALQRSLVMRFALADCGRRDHCHAGSGALAACSARDTLQRS